MQPSYRLLPVWGGPPWSPWGRCAARGCAGRWQPLQLPRRPSLPSSRDWSSNRQRSCWRAGDLSKEIRAFIIANVVLFRLERRAWLLHLRPHLPRAIVVIMHAPTTNFVILRAEMANSADVWAVVYLSRIGHGCCPVHATGGSLSPCGRYWLANKEESMRLTTLRVRPAHTRFPPNTPLHFIPGVWPSWGSFWRLGIVSGSVPVYFT